MQPKLSATQDISHLNLSEEQKFAELKALIDEAYAENIYVPINKVKAHFALRKKKLDEEPFGLEKINVPA